MFKDFFFFEMVKATVQKRKVLCSGLSLQHRNIVGTFTACVKNTFTVSYSK